MSATGTRGECTVASNICAPNDNVQALSFYDFRGRMVTAVEKTSGGTTLESVTYTYDALDNRIGMDENGTQTWTLYDSGNPIMDFNSSGSLTMRYLWGPTGIVARQTSGGTVSWYLADALGTVRDLLNNSGAIIDHVDFSAFGTVLDESSPASGDRMMGFAMLERDTVTGLNLAVFRDENPGTGRWNSQDPLGFAAGDANLARYVENDPSTSSDSFGLQPQKKKRTQSDNDYRPTNPIAGEYPTGSELWDPKIFPKIASDMEDIRKLSKDGAERGFVVFRNPKTGRYRNVRAPRGTRNKIDFNKVRRPFGDWEVVCVVHSHPAGGATDPARSPLDPDNSNSNILGDPPAPWLVVGPDGTVYLIGPDQVGGKRNRHSRMRQK
jgi:RHS repeat-associated protein